MEIPKTNQPKILLVYKSHNNWDISDNSICGGIEKFCQLFYNNIPNVVPCKITTEDRQNKRTKEVIAKHIIEHSPDVIWCNDPDASITRNDLGVPVILLFHSGEERDIRIVEFVKKLPYFMGDLYFVSEKQKKWYDVFSQRINGFNIPKYEGYISPTFSTYEDLPQNVSSKSVITIARCNRLKNPFWITKYPNIFKLKIFSSIHTKLSGDDEKYYNKWKDDPNTEWNKEYDYIMDNLAISNVHVSTCAAESFGITILEAAERGIPSILIKDKNGTHSGVSIIRDPRFYKLVDKNITPEALKAVTLDLLSNITYEHRVAFSNNIKERYSRDSFINNISNAVNKAISRNDKRNLWL